MAIQTPQGISSSSEEAYLGNHLMVNQIFITWKRDVAERGWDPMHKWCLLISHRPIAGIHPGGPDNWVRSKLQLPWAQSFEDAKDCACKVASKEWHVHLSWEHVAFAPRPPKWVLHLQLGDSIAVV